jgi:general secretion pathway protein D
LVSDQVTNGNGGIPLLKDIPVLGNLFKSSSKDDTKTELVLIIVPYIIENNDQAEEVTHAITRQLKTIAPAALSPAPLRKAEGRAAPPRVQKETPPGA